jgi:hypothetical protein
MKLDENRPINAMTRTNSKGLVRNGKRENPIAWAMKETNRIRLPCPDLSRMLPHKGDNTIVSIAGARDVSEIRRNEAPRDRR